MKKLLMFFLCLLLIGSYSRTDHFKMANVSQVTLNDSVLEKNDIQDLLLNLDHMTESEAISGEAFELKIDRYIGDDLYRVFLDYNFDYIVLEKEGEYFKTPYNASYFYESPITESLFDYIYYRNHEIILDQPIESGKRSLKYLFSDNNWHEISEQYGKTTTLELSSDVDFKVDSHGGNTTMVLNGEIIDHFYLPEKNGFYELVITTTWEDPLFTARDETHIDIQVKKPVVFSLSKESIEQGEVNTLTVMNTDVMPSIESSYMEGLYFNPIVDGFECVIPSTYYTTPGVYEILVSLEDQNETFSFEVLDRDFRIQYLTVSSSTVASTQTDEAYEQYRKYYKAALLEETYQAERVSFILPTEGRLTTEFGENRYVNNQKTSYHHAGWDIANNQGTEVFASGDGEVVLSMPLTVTGNSIVISHGKGLFTTYFHLNELIANEGDLVKQGDLIGKMGTTGFSTGNHLHFSISYYQMNLEPGYFIYNTRITKENYKEFFNQ